MANNSQNSVDNLSKDKKGSDISNQERPAQGITDAYKGRKDPETAYGANVQPKLNNEDGFKNQNVKTKEEKFPRKTGAVS